MTWLCLVRLHVTSDARTKFLSKSMAAIDVVSTLFEVL